MRTTLQDQLRADQQRRQDRFRQQHEDWLSQHNPVVSHAVTLTLLPAVVRAFANSLNCSVTTKSPEMMNHYTKALRKFGHSLDRSLFGNAAGRNDKSIFMVPSFEGFQTNKKLHIHVAIGIPEDRFLGIDDKVHRAWSGSTPFAGYTHTIPTYDSSGWNFYIVKEAVFIDRKSIDWWSVKLPKS